MKITREKAVELISIIRDVIKKENALKEYLQIQNLKESDIKTELIGVSNGFLSEILLTIVGYDVEVYGEVEEMYPCPCCGYKTLTEIYNKEEGSGYDICPYCNWEDDGTIEINEYTSVNKGSIQDYRDNINSNVNRYYVSKWLRHK